MFLILNFVAPEINSNWVFHLEILAEMLTYGRACDHYNYMNWVIVYLLDMYDLPEKHPLFYQYFVEEFHAVS